MLTLLLLLYHASAKVMDTSQETHIIKNIATCPDIGYYFNREVRPNAIEPTCQLCFCRNSNSAVCWPRDLRRCDVKNYQHYGRKKRSRTERVRRSPGISDIFFRDAAKDVFNKNTPEECKPFESSLSEGCPPADWCIGCTVCDCDANGRWDCHVLSFCPDDKGNKVFKKKRGKVKKRQKTKKTPPTTMKPRPKATKKLNIVKSSKILNKRQHMHEIKRRKNNITPKSQSEPNKGKAKNVMIPVTKTKPVVYKKKLIQSSNDKPNNKLIRKYKNPPKYENGNTKTFNEHEELLKNFSHTLFKKVMASVEKIVLESQKNITRAIQEKSMLNRSMPTHFMKSKDKKNTTQKIKSVKKGINSVQNQKNLKKSSRNKREISSTISTKYYLQEDNTTFARDDNVTENIFIYHSSDSDKILATPMANILTKSNYFKYNVDSNTDNVHNYENLNTTPKEGLRTLVISNISSSEVTFHSKSFAVNNTTHSYNNNTSYKTFKGTTSAYISRQIFRKEIKNIKKTLKINDIDSVNVSTIDFTDNANLKFNETCGMLCKFKNMFTKFVVIGNDNTTTPKQSYIKKFNISKYLERVFGKNILKTKTRDKLSKRNKKQATRNRNLITSICENFGSCKVVPKDKKIFSKIYQLKSESRKIMKSVKSIKGLLKLLDINHKNMNINSTDINKRILRNDIEKLNAIIKDNYDEHLDNLTETQRVQVGYIKQNTKIFMQSLENFAEILNDIVKSLTNHKYHKHDILNRCTRSTNIQDKITTIINKNNTVEEKLNYMKEFLVKYNLVQNKLIKRMYDVIVTLGSKNNVTTTHTENSIKVSNNSKKYNEKIAMEIYTKNVIKNLRKLKKLAQKLSFNNRKKREAVEDNDVVEYLLILLEYLLKQKKHLTISPANDGIDLLIEAIKSAPEIQVTRKKVLDNFPVRTKTIKVTTADEATINILNATKITNEIKSSSNDVVAKFKTFESVDDDEDSDFYEYNKNFSKNTFKMKNKLEMEDAKEEDIVYIMTTMRSDIEVQEVKKGNVGLDKTGTKKRDGDKGYEIFNDDTDEEEIVIVTTTTSPRKITEQVTKRYSRPTKTTLSRKFNDLITTRSPKVSSQHNRIKLDWIEDSYNQEDDRKEPSMLIITTTQKPTPTHTTPEVVTRNAAMKNAKKLNKYDDPVSSMSTEVADEDIKKTKNLHSESTHKKQSNLFNSLDYGTEKTEMEADSSEDRTNVEQFPLYFV